MERGDSSDTCRSAPQVADFVRTTEARHGVTVEALWRALEARGEIYMGKHEGWYCRSDEAFLTEMQVSHEHSRLTRVALTRAGCRR